MAVRSATLRTLPSQNIKPARNTSPLIYPLYMQDDQVVGEKNETIYGQDRIEFKLFRLKGIANVDNAEPFPGLTNQEKEENRYEEVKLTIGETTVNGVYLPIQDKIQDQNAVNWEGSGFNEFQRQLANLSFAAMQGNMENIDKTTEAMGKFIGNNEFGNFARMYLVEQAISVQNLFTRATGQILNPNLELLFNSPTLRPFTYNFQLSPRDPDEAVVVKKIIKFFKKGMAPRTKKNLLFLNAPYIFGIRYLLGSTNTDHPSINKIKKCALQACTVDYTPNNSYMTFNDVDGTMVGYNLNLTFQELFPIFDEDYDEEVSISYTGSEEDRSARTQGKTLDHKIGY